MTDTRRNALLALLFFSLQALQLGVIPLLLLPRDVRWGWLLLIPVLFTNSWWAFMHEALHGHAFPGKAHTRRLGRLNAVLFGAAFDLLRIGHLLHHAFSRTPRDRSEVYVPGRDNHARFAAAYYFRLLGGLYFFEVVGSLLFLAPQRWIKRVGARLAGSDNVVEEIVGHLLQPPMLAAVRAEMLAMLTLYAACFYAYGKHGWMLALALCARGLLISLMDNVFHYGSPLGDAQDARDLALPPWAARLLLHFNLHGVHHRKAGLAWYALPRQHHVDGAAYQGNLWRALLAQIRGPIAESALPKRGG